MKLLLFDIDGTLILTGGAGIRALDRAFSKVYGVENAMAGIRPHGKTDPAIVREILLGCGRKDQVEEATRRILDDYVEFLQDEVQRTEKYHVLPGIQSFLEKFHERPDLSFGLATGNVERGARIKLERGDLNRYFRFGGFGSDSESRAELVRAGAGKCGQIIVPEDTFVIGDTPLDILAGKAAGFRTVGVATSDYSKADLEAAGADLAMSDFEQDLDQFLRWTRIA